MNPSDPKNLEEAHRLQDALTIEQKTAGNFEIPNWDPVSQKTVREALLVLASTVTNTQRAFGTKEEVDPIQHLISAASAWGGNSPKDAVYLNVTPEKNDGTTVYQLTVKDVPVGRSVLMSPGKIRRSRFPSVVLQSRLSPRQCW